MLRGSYPVVISKNNIPEFAMLVLDPEVGNSSTKSDKGSLRRVVGRDKVHFFERLVDKLVFCTWHVVWSFARNERLTYVSKLAKPDRTRANAKARYPRRNMTVGGFLRIQSRGARRDASSVKRCSSISTMRHVVPSHTLHGSTSPTTRNNS